MITNDLLMGNTVRVSDRHDPIVTGLYQGPYQKTPAIFGTTTTMKVITILGLFGMT